MKKLDIKPLKITNIYSLDRVYELFSKETKLFFHPGFLGTKKINKAWIFNHIKLIFSTIVILRRFLLKVHPSLVILVLLAFNKKNKIVGFSYLMFTRPLPDGEMLSEMGVGVKENYRGLGLGSKLTEDLLSLAKKEKIKKIKLAVLADNKKAINLYKKHGFAEKGFIKDGESYQGKLYDNIEMEKDLS